MRLARFGLFVLVVAMLCPISAEATAKLNFKVLPGEAGPVRVEMEGPDGVMETFESAEMRFVVEPEGGAGTYRLVVTVGSVTDETEVEVQAQGYLNITFDPEAPGTKFSIRQGGAIESITVTAQRVEQSMQQVPVAITALTSQDLEEQHITNIKDLAVASPNLWMQPNTSSNSGARAAIRGVGEDESMFTSDTPIGIYIDDVYIPRQTGAMFDLYDVERIEVLRGPQGTLYGRNTSAGAIKLITRGPTEELTLSLEAELGNFSLTDLSGSVGVPVSDQFRFQLAAMVTQRDGYDTNLYNGEDVNDQDIWGVRGTMEFQPSESLDISLVGDMLEDRSGPGFPLGFIPQPPIKNGFGTGIPSFDHQIDGDTDPHTLLSDLENPSNDVDQSGVYATINWQASEWIGFKSISAYREMENLLIIDGDGQIGNQFLPGIIPDFLPLFHILQDQEQEQFSQELQLSGTVSENIDFIAGIYYFNEKNEQITENAVLSPLGTNRFSFTTLDTDSIAGFGSFDFRLNDTVTLTVGGRWTEDNKDFDLTVFNPDGSQMFACVGPDGTILNSTGPCSEDAPAGSVNTPVAKKLEETWSRFTPRVALSYAPRENFLAYLDISTGFKSGAFDGRANEGITVLPLEPVPPEDIVAYEAGIKTDLLGGIWRLNVAAFYTDYDDLQGTGTDPNGNFIRFSIGDVETKGLEIETVLMPTPGFELTANVGLLDTKFTEQNFNQAVDCAPYCTGDQDLELKYSPEISYRIGGTYTTDAVWPGGYWSVNGSYSYKDDHYLGFCNAGAQTGVAYSLVDAIVAFDTEDSRWRFAIAGKNLADEEYIIGVFAIPGLRIVSGYIGPPRTYSFTVSYRF